MDWFKKAHLGVIIHWGVYSVPAFDVPKLARRRKIQNGSEWYYPRLKIKEGAFRTISGWKETQSYHSDKYGDRSYYDLAKDFSASKFSAKKIVSYLSGQGVKYLVITAKHHDGFCMWPNARRTLNIDLPWNAGDIGPKRDILGELKKECTKYNIKFGVYYSLSEVDYPSASKKYITSIVLPDLEDLRERYHPDLWWFDGDWSKPYRKWMLEPFLKKIREEGAITNDRLGKGSSGVHGDYQNYSDRYTSEEWIPRKWESIVTIGLSWGRNEQQSSDDYKDECDMYELFIDTITKNGNLLVNLCLDSEGEFDPREKEVFDIFSEFVKMTNIPRTIKKGYPVPVEGVVDV